MLKKKSGDQNIGEALYAAGIDRAQCRKLLHKLSEKKFESTYFDKTDDAVIIVSHLNYLEGLGLCKVIVNNPLFVIFSQLQINNSIQGQNLPKKTDWAFSARLTTDGIQRLEVALKTGKDVKIDAADDFDPRSTRFWKAVWKFICKYCIPPIITFLLGRASA